MDEFDEVRILVKKMIGLNMQIRAVQNNKMLINKKEKLKSLHLRKSIFTGRFEERLNGYKRELDILFTINGRLFDEIPDGLTEYEFTTVMYTRMQDLNDLIETLECAQKEVDKKELPKSSIIDRSNEIKKEAQEMLKNG